MIQRFSPWLFFPVALALWWHGITVGCSPHSVREAKWKKGLEPGYPFHAFGDQLASPDPTYSAQLRAKHATLESGGDISKLEQGSSPTLAAFCSMVAYRRHFSRNHCTARATFSHSGCRVQRNACFQPCAEDTQGFQASCVQSCACILFLCRMSLNTSL